MADIFVSYKAEDRRRVAPLVHALEGDGYSVWWDEQIRGGTAWRHTIETELNAAKCALVVWSKRSVGPHGTFVQDEASRAQERLAYVPVTIDKVHLPLGFGETQAFPLTGWHGDPTDSRYQALLTAIKRVSKGLPYAPARVSPDGISRRAVLGGAAAATAGAAALGAWFLLKPAVAATSGSIAVLPFANLSGDPHEAYFSDGIAEELRNALAQLTGLKVAGRISSEAVRDLDAKTAARRLRVANVLTGSVRQSASTIRISAELIDGRTGLDRWSQDYDRPPGDAIMIQSDIAENVASSLAVALGTVARAAVALGGTANAAAQRLVIQARAVARERTKPARLRALDLVSNAIRLDPKYAEAYGLKSLMLGSYANNFASNPAELNRMRDEAMRLAEIAIRIAPNLAIGHAAIAQLFQSNLDIARAANAFDRAVQLAPGNADIVGRYVYLLARIGRQTDALTAADRVVGLDPLNHFSYENRASALYDLRRYRDALDYAQKVRRDSPELFKAPGLSADCLLMLGRPLEASRVYGELDADSWQQLNGQTLALARAGHRSAAVKNLAKFKRLFGDTSSYQYGGIYAQLGDREQALGALEQALAIRDGGLVSIKIDPLLDPIRREPRFEAVVKRMNFPV